MVEQRPELPKPFLWGLACAALSPGLRSLLLFDARPDTLRVTALTLAHMLALTTQKPVTVVQISSADTEETLWGGFSLVPGESGPAAHWRPGALVPEHAERALRLVLIPDLARLSLAARRACTMLIGSDVASLDRYGHHEEWLPEMCWVAGCAVGEMGQVSVHLHDRFAVRMDGRHIGRRSNKVDDLVSRLANSDSLQVGVTADAAPIDWPGYSPAPAADSLLPADIVDTLRAAASRPAPDATSEAIARICEYKTDAESYHPRREITLARLAVANAHLLDAKQVTVEHVDSAARMLNQRLSLPLPPNQRPTPSTTPRRKPKKPNPLPEPTPSSGYTSSAVDDYTAPEALDEAEHFAPSPLVEEPYREDDAPIEHEWESLRLPAGRDLPIIASHGAIIGVEPSRSLHDVAVTATLLESAKYQAIRRKNTRTTARTLQVSPTDLHHYRRAPVQTHLLVLLIDYTSLGKCQWEDAVFSHLVWAYQKRAAICLIQVGAAGARSEFQAEQIRERNVLSPRIDAALTAAPGRATPLAHGLDLALQALKRSLQQGNDHVEEARLIVLTDGRGNVTLNDSRANRISAPITREGIEDALMVARQIAGLRHVQSAVLDPQPRTLADLPDRLADALGAGITKILPRLTNIEHTQVAL